MKSSERPESTAATNSDSFMSGHAPVLLAEVLACLAPRDGDIYADLTAGRGGHASEVAKLVEIGQIVLFDLDAQNLAFAQQRVEAAASSQRGAIGAIAAATSPSATPAIHTIHGSFASTGRELTARQLHADMVLADLGFASTQVDDPARGLSFMRDGPLDMRLDPSAGMTAADLVNGSDPRELADIIARFGEEPMARRIADKIAARRAEAPILTTAQLADLVREAYGSRARSSRLHPATKTFQALRIAVNDELGALGALLSSIHASARRISQGQPTWLQHGARIAVISFHSLEDRMVKQCFAAMRDEGLCDEITRGALVSSESECAENPRARSAKLRAVRIGGTKAHE